MIKTPVLIFCIRVFVNVRADRANVTLAELILGIIVGTLYDEKNGVTYVEKEETSSPKNSDEVRSVEKSIALV
jgi:hypothetical protein